ncbi:hypothetical protein ACQCT6_14775 [Cytobacillus gottheilii]|uniref:YbyB n=1 Tax=Cytobacillus gottheilii TaxID=859144 RepID=A0ABX8FD92_9BACI|nr:hypothetical protein [Cytobacillus gottheilii]QVY62281.1 hypothetical protein J1899_04020 [Cytobacillus gottheilii]
MNSRPLNSYLLAGVGITSVLLLASKANRNKVQTVTVKFKNMIRDRFANEDLPLKKAGHPDPQDIEDNKMVSEGAMYSVAYYNENEQQK